MYEEMSQRGVWRYRESRIINIPTFLERADDRWAAREGVIEGELTWSYVKNCGWYDLPHDFSEPLVWGVWIKKSCMMNFIDQKQQFSQNIIWKLNLIIFKTSEILQNSIKLNHWSDLTEFLRSAQSQVKVKF